VVETIAPGREAEVRAELGALIGLDLRTDLLEPLGQTFAFYFSDTTGGGDLSSAVMLAAVDDPERLRASIESLAARLSALAAEKAAGRVRIQAFEHGSARGFRLDFPGLPVPLGPALALQEGTLFAAATPQALVAALDHARRGAGGPSEFLEQGWRTWLGPALAGSLADVQQVFYVDTPRFARQGYGMASLLGAALANGLRSPADPGRDAGLVFPPLGELLCDSIPTVMVSRLRGRDLVSVGTGDHSAAAQVSALLGFAPSVLSGAVLLGAFGAVVARNAAHELPEVEYPLEGDGWEEHAWEDHVSEDSPEGRARDDIWTLLEALEGHASENGGLYPDSLEALLVPDEEGLSWLDELPLDPWGNPYVYSYDGEHARVLSLGADGLPGGEGADRDLTSDELGAAGYLDELELDELEPEDGD
jgi:hypothetical protein